MEDREIRGKRKDEHLLLAQHLPDGPGSSGFENINLIHDSVPELDLEEIDLGYIFLGKKIKFPLLINAITGGTQQAAQVNQALSTLAARQGIAMAVGSQTIAIEDPGLKYTFALVREANPDGIVLANISAASGVKEAIAAVEMIKADGLQLHFNIPQELAMPEGDRSFKGILKQVKEIKENCPVPIIAKEVGFGFSRESIERIYQSGVSIFDIGGQGGTNFVTIEDQRQGMFGSELDQWGIPTAVSLIEALSMDLPIKIIASGGIRSALDAAKALALGADMVGMAGSLLKILLNHGSQELERELTAWLYRLKAVFLMNGAANLEEIKNKPVIILNDTAQWIKSRGIDKYKWSRR